jgi:DNA-binding LacI/PurR family transcriptional regulator
VFRSGASVADATRARVLEAAMRVGYRPNAIAASLITRRSNLAAVVISNLTNLHYPEVLAALTRQLSSHDMRVLLFTLSTESEIDQVLDQVWRYRVDGAIVAARLSAEQEAAFQREGVPMVLYNRLATSNATDVVCCEAEQGAGLLVNGLLRAGRRRFGLIAGPADSAVGEARLQGAIAWLRAAGLLAMAEARGDYSHESGMVAMRRLRELAPDLDAVVSANDVMALGAIDVLRHEFSAEVPDDVAVVGFDGVAPSAWPSYRLTTIRQPVEDMTEAAVAMLLDRIADPDRPAVRRLFAGALVEGQTARLG